ncbi:MAG: hypothetical protein RR298_02755 [Alistipes sp.]
MKKTFFAKLFACLLAGVMLTAVGCKDYDDDITDLNNRIDGLTTGTIATMASQIASMQTAITGLQTMDTQLDAAIKVLQTKVTTLSETQGNHTTEIAAIIAKATALQTQLEKAITDYKAADKTNADAIAAANERITNLKKDLEKAIAAVAAVGAQNAADIANLNLRIVELEKAKIDLQNQIAAVKATADAAATAKDLNDFKTMQENLNTTFATITVTNEIKQTIADLEIKLQNQIDLRPTLETVKAMITTASAETLAAAEESFGKTLEETLKNYTTTAELEKKLQALAADISIAAAEAAKANAAVIALKAQVEQFEGKITTAIADACAAGGVIDNAIATAIANENARLLKDVINPMKAQIADLEAKFTARIQSLVLVPASFEGSVTNNMIYFMGNMYVLDDNDEKHYLRADGEDKITTMTFRVTPAQLAATLVANPTALSIVMEEIPIGFTRATAPYFNVTEVTMVDAATGKFAVTAVTNYPYSSKNSHGGDPDRSKNAVEDVDKTIAIALHVDASKYATPESPSDVDYTTSFIPTIGGSEENITEDFGLVYNAAAPGAPADWTDVSSPVETNFPYTDLTYGHDFLTEPANVVMFYDYETREYITIEAAAKQYGWNVTPSFTHSFLAKSTFAKGDGVNDDASKYDLKNKMTFKLGGRNPQTSTNYIGNVITSGECQWSLVDGDKTIASVGRPVKEIVTIVGVDALINAPDVEMAWNYTIASGTKAYSAAKTNFLPDGQKNVVSSTDYIEMKSIRPYMTLYSDAECTEDVYDIDPFMVLSATPKVGTDVQDFTVQFTNNTLDSTATYYYKAVYEFSSKNTATIKGKVIVTGMPEKLNTLSIEKKFTLVNNQSAYDVWADYATTLYNQLSTTEKKACGDKTIFLTAIQAATFNASAAADNDYLQTANPKMQVVFDANAVLGHECVLGATIKAGWGLNTVVTVTTGLEAPKAVLVHGTSWYEKGGESFATANSVLHDAAFNVRNLDLKTVFNAQPVIAGVKVTYSIKTDMTAATGTATVKDNVLNWGTYNKLSLNLEAQMSLDGHPFGKVEPFTVVVLDPIVGEITGDATELTVVAEEANNVTVTVGKALNLMTIATAADPSYNVFVPETGALVANVVTALNAKVTYGAATISNGSDGRISFNKTTGVVTVAKSETKLAANVTVTIPVTFTYTYGTRTKNIVVTIEPEGTVHPVA